MIKLYDGQITDLLPEKIAKDTDTQCVSYAIQQEHQRLLRLTDRTRTLSVIDELPEKILDVLAVELRTPYYWEDMDLATKRNIIKKTLLWHTKAGTPIAVEELVEIVFGEGLVVEWFDFDEAPYTPGTFDIVTNARMTEDIAEQFLSIIQRVKNTRSHIRRILINRELEMNETVATGAVSSPKEAILNHHQMQEKQTMNERLAAGVSVSPKFAVTNSPQGRTANTGMAGYAAASMASSPKEIIGNNAEPRAESAGGATCVAAVAKASTRIIIYNGAFQSQATVQVTQGIAVGMASHSKITI